MVPPKPQPKSAQTQQAEKQDKSPASRFVLLHLSLRFTKLLNFRSTDLSHSFYQGSIVSKGKGEVFALLYLTLEYLSATFTLS